jgi:phosphohistidine phosphatase
MKIFILRHGPATHECGPDGTDASRSLTREGKEQVRQVARAMKHLEVLPAIILTSPLVRARQTAEIAAQQLNLAADQLRETDSLKPGSDPAELVRELRKLDLDDRQVMLVGHEPDLSHFVSLLTSGSPEPVLSFKKTGLARIDCDSLKPGRCGLLRWHMQPSQMKMMI